MSKFAAMYSSQTFFYESSQLPNETWNIFNSKGGLFNLLCLSSLRNNFHWEQRKHQPHEYMTTIILSENSWTISQKKQLNKQFFLSTESSILNIPLPPLPPVLVADMTGSTASPFSVRSGVQWSMFDLHKCNRHTIWKMHQTLAGQSTHTAAGWKKTHLDAGVHMAYTILLVWTDWFAGGDDEASIDMDVGVVGAILDVVVPPSTKAAHPVLPGPCAWWSCRDPCATWSSNLRRFN
jgi:hypothetical protein